MPVVRTKESDRIGSPGSDSSSNDLPMTMSTSLDNGKLRVKKQNKSCDACRARKVRCTRSDEDTERSCKHCTVLNVPCTYDYIPKKRGPPTLFVCRRLSCDESLKHSDGTPASRGSMLPPPVPSPASSFTYQSSSSSGSTTYSPSVTSLGSSPWSSPRASTILPNPGFGDQTHSSYIPETDFSPVLSPIILPPSPMSPSMYPIAADNYWQEMSYSAALTCPDIFTPLSTGPSNPIF